MEKKNVRNPQNTEQIRYKRKDSSILQEVIKVDL